MKRTLAATLLFCLTACFPSPPDRARYSLAPQISVAQARHDHSRGHGIVRVLMPEGEYGLASDRIAIRSGGEQSFIENAAWSEPLGKTLQASLIDALRSSGAFAEAVDDYNPANASLMVETQIERFTVVDGKQPHVEVALRVDFLRPASRQLIASLTAEDTASVAQVRMHEVVPAFNKALGRCIDQITARAAKLH